MKEEKKFNDQYREDVFPSTQLDEERLDEVSGGVDRIKGEKSEKNSKERKQTVII